MPGPILNKRPNPLTVVAVSAYLLLVGTWLLLTRQIQSPGLMRILLAMARPAYRGELRDARNEVGFCSIASMPDRVLSDQESVSRLVVFENGRPLGPAHACHADIRGLGGGRFSHWGDKVYFSASDNSDPRTNGRKYTVAEVKR